MNNFYDGATSIYTYSCREEERPLCRLEMRSFFGFDSESFVLESPIRVDPSRSAFIRERIDVILKETSLQDLTQHLNDIPLRGQTFKVVFIKNPDLIKTEQISFEERRKIEREVGLHIQGKADMKNPERLFGITHVKGCWIFGDYIESDSVWFRHQKKPNDYSTALNTRVARAVVNIAVPKPTGVTVIDPCCGIGTVVVEARSMGVDIVGSDINPLACIGARENLKHFGYGTEIIKRDIRDINESYDVAIIDLPYNLCSVITPEEQLEMLQSARKLAEKVVVVTVEEIDSILNQAGFKIVDRCEIKKGMFIRQVIVSE